MTSTIFDVTTEVLESSASNLEVKIKEFTKAYTNIYTAVSDLHVKYKGEASDMFNQRIEGYKNDFSAVEKALQNYIQSLRDYASNVKGTEDEIKSGAAALSTGR